MFQLSSASSPCAGVGLRACWVVLSASPHPVMGAATRGASDGLFCSIVISVANQETVAGCFISLRAVHLCLNPLDIRFSWRHLPHHLRCSAKKKDTSSLRCRWEGFAVVYDIYRRNANKKGQVLKEELRNESGREQVMCVTVARVEKLFVVGQTSVSWQQRQLLFSLHGHRMLQTFMWLFFILRWHTPDT